MVKHLKYLILIFVGFVVVTCSVSRKSSIPRNLERIYDPHSSSFRPEIDIFNYSDTTSIIAEKIYINDLLYNHANTENKLLAKVKIVYNLYDLTQKQKLTDSSTTTFRFEKDPTKNYKIFEIEINSKLGHNYFLEIVTIDQNRNNSQYTFKHLNREEGRSGKDYIIYNNEDEIILNSVIYEGQDFKIKSYKKHLDSLKVFFFSNNQEVAVIPYEKDTLDHTYEKADTSWICYTDSLIYTNYSKEGIYYFTEEVNAKEFKDAQGKGFALFNFGKDFPTLKSPGDLIKPLTYLNFIDTISNFDTIGSYTKLAVDNFWLARANNKDRSRELLKAFYNRVMFANIYFTSYKKGWQTDRGMVYIIYGLPDYLFKSGIEEKWIYNPTGIGPGISFTFTFSQVPFSSNHYILEREKLKATGWDEAVELWNNGEVIYYQN